MIVLTKVQENKIMVLRKIIDDKEASRIVANKKTSLFKSMLKKPKKEEVHVDSIKLTYECLLKLSGKYIADYFRRKVHTISVDSNVQEVAFGGGVFPIKEKSFFKRAFVGSRGKNKIDLPMEEHVFVENADEVVLDHNGTMVEFPFKINSKTMENYPDKILEENLSNVKGPKLTNQNATKLLENFLKKSLEADIQKLNEEFILQEITEVYVPIYEARLTGPKNKVELLRLDAIRNKVL